MREIKFRAWNSTIKEMSYCNEWKLTYYTVTIYDFFNNFIPFKKEGMLFMQYTGLKDRNDVEIYEGDIGKFNDFYIGDYLQKAGKAVVEYDKDIIGLFRGDEFICGLFDAVMNHGFEIIGNVYENRDLY